ncbi:MAG: hypothetical protein NTX66_00695, partial [Candidatus Falkowbacteria bacterium]|nr:hypothetical protein [Candidatus Falkowbacteria bacterium]
WHFYKPIFDFTYSHPNISPWTSAPADLSFSLLNDKLKLNDDFKLKLDYKNNNYHLDSIKISFISLDPDYSFSPDSYTLKNLNSEISDSLDISLNLRGNAIKNHEVNWQAQIEYRGGQETYKDFKLLPRLKILSDLKASAKIYYNSPQGDQLGAGPIPPQIGLPTNYWVSLAVLGLTTDLGNFIMSAQLPKNVNLTDKKSLLAGNLKYTPGNRQVIWSIPQFDSEATASAGFEIQFIPGSDQAGKIADLLKNIRYSATDKLTDTELSGALNNLNTNLEFDRINSGQGRVEK